MKKSPFAQRLQRVIDNDPDLTPAGLAVKAGLDNSAVRSLLSGRVKNPRLDTSIRICAALGTTLEDFMSGDYEAGQLPTDPENQRIRALLSELSPHERHLLLSYAEGLRDAKSQDSTQPPQDDE